MAGDRGPPRAGCARPPSAGRGPSRRGARPRARGSRASRGRSRARGTRRRGAASASVSAISVLVDDLRVVVRRVAAWCGPVLTALHPQLGRLGDGRGPEVERDEREGDVAAVADHVDEARLGQDALNRLGLADVAGRLVAPARLALLLGVEPVEGADRLGGGERLDRGARARALAGVEAEVAPAGMAGDDRGQLVGGHRPLDAAGDHVGDEVRLGRDRHLGDARPASAAAASCPSGWRRR